MAYTKVVIVGGGFGGLNTAKSLKGAKLDILLIDKTNHHLFQPLLYQVATAALLLPGPLLRQVRELSVRVERLYDGLDPGVLPEAWFETHPGDR